MYVIITLLSTLQYERRTETNIYNTANISQTYVIINLLSSLSMLRYERRTEINIYNIRNIS